MRTPQPPDKAPTDAERKTLRCINAFERMTETKEGRRNMKHLDHNLVLDNMDSRDVFPWPESVMEVFNKEFTTKVQLAC